MARKSSAKMSSRNLSNDVDLDSRSEGAQSSSSAGSFDINYRQIAMDLYNNPTVRYMAGGVAAAILNRVASRLGNKYPEIGSFLKENIGTLEGKLNEFKSGMNTDRGEEARH